MKKLILSAFLFATLLSCSTDEDNSTQGTQNNCNCGKVIECANYYVPGMPFTVIKVKNNCTQVVKSITVLGTQQLLNQQYCN
jgi:hypothetical protein